MSWKWQDVVETGNGCGGRPRTAADVGSQPEWHNLVADVEDLVKKVAHVDDDGDRGDPRQGRGHAREGQDLRSAGIAAVRGRAEDASEATDEYVRENPWAAIGIAAAVGIVIGFVAGRR